MKIAVTGYRGKLGGELVRQGCVPLDCDVTDPDSISVALGQVKPDTIIHCAAIGGNKVDWCETDEGQKESYRVNVRGTAYMRWGFPGPMILISTSYIFDGDSGPYDEKVRGVPYPVNNYGFSKLAAEAVFQEFTNGTIVRTVGLYGGDRDDFAKQIISRTTSGDTIYALRALSFNPTYAPHLATALIELAYMKNPPRVVNVAGSDILSRYEFALQVAEVFNLDKSLILPTDKVDGWIAPRPRQAGLKLKLAKRLGLTLHGVMEGLTAMREAMYATA